jgi:hypothetical protein
MYSKDQIDKMKDALTLREMDNIDDGSLYDVLMNGCTGYDNMEDEDIINFYEDIFGPFKDA